MERRTALATSLTIFATVTVGTIAFASLGGIDILGFGGDDQQATPTIITQAPDSTGAVTVDGTTTTAVDPQQAAEPVTTDATGNPVPVSSGTPGGPASTAPGPTSPGAPATTGAPGPTTGPTPAPTSPPTVAPTTPTTPATTPRTTSPPTTTAPKSTLPPGVPSDWPPGKPIPPMPVGCIDGQLEDNGVWNCQH